jgi:hypothetical protein
MTESMKGRVISAEEAKARWAYTEINSERFGRTYETDLPAELFKGAKDGVPFERIAAIHYPILIAALKRSRNAGFIDKVDRWGAPIYECVEWQVTDLLNSTTIPAFGRVPYFVFLARPPGKDARGNPRAADPRHKSHFIPFDPAFEPREPLIAIAVDNAPMLIEGYLRSILWLRNPARRLPVWLPKP